MQTIALRSSNLRTAAYDEWLSQLVIAFQSGAVYAYSGVPPQVFDGLLAAESPGRFHHRFIKFQYPYSRLR